MPDIKELGRRVKAKYPEYNDLSDEEVGRRVKAKYPEYSDFTDIPDTQMHYDLGASQGTAPAVTGQPARMGQIDQQPAQPPQPSWYDRLKQNLGVGAASGYLGLTEPVETAGNIVSSALTGDFGPLKEVGKGVAQRVGQLYAAAQPGGAGMTAAMQGAIEQTQQQRNQQQFQQGNVPAITRAAQQAQLEKLAAQDPSLLGRVTRGAVSTAIQSVPYAASGGSVPAMAGIAALQSIGEPENIPLNVAGAVALPYAAQAAGRYVAPILQRIRGGAAAVEEAAAPAVQPTTARTLPQAAAETGNASPVVQRAMARYSQAVEDINASNLSPAEKAQALQQAIKTIGEQAQAESPIVHRMTRTGVYNEYPGTPGYPPALQRFPENPNAVQVAGELPASVQPNNLQQMQAFFTQAAQEGAASGKANPEGLARAIGTSADDTGNVSTADLGLASKFPPQRPADAVKMQMAVPLDDITVGKDTLNRGRMFQLQEKLEEGVKPPVTGVPLKQQIDPIELAPDPQNPGQFIVENDGNHRVALLKLQGYDGEVPVTVWASPEQANALKAASRATSGPALESAGLNVNAAGGAGGGAQPGQPTGTPPPELTGPLWERPPEEQRLIPAPPANPPPEQTGSAFTNALGQRQLFSDRVITAQERTPVLQTIGALFKAGFLSLPNVHLKVLAHMGGFQISEELARIPGALLDIVLSPIFKRRQLYGPSVSAVARSAYEAATKGAQEAWQLIKTGKAANAPELQEINSGIPLVGKIVDTYVNFIFRLHAAEDQLVRTYALRRALIARADVMAKTEARQGNILWGQVGERTREILKAPPADLQAAAVLDAGVATFNNPNIPSAIRTSISQGLEKFGQKYPLAKPGAQAADLAITAIMPFVKKPANVIGKTLEQAGITAIPKLTYQATRAILKGSMSEAEQLSFEKTFGRAGLGGGLIGLGYIGYRDGWLTGIREDDNSKRARDVASGRIPGAILVNGTWHQIAGTSAFGDSLIIGASLARETEQAQMQAKELAQKGGKESSTLDQTLAAAGAGAKVVGHTLLEQPMLMGPKQAIEGLDKPGTAGARYLGGLAGSVVPGAVAGAAQLIDYGVQREAKTLPERVMERIPFVRQMLPERLDVLGRPVPAPFPGDITKGTTAQQLNSPLFAELVRLDIGIPPVVKKSTETDNEHRQNVKDFGSLYLPYGEQLVASPEYQQATEQIKQDAFKYLDSRAKSLVDKGAMAYAAGPLSPAALIAAATVSEIRKPLEAQRKAAIKAAMKNASMTH